MRRTLIPAVLAFGLVLAACTAPSTSTTSTSVAPVHGGPLPGQVFAAPALAPFASCDAFLEYAKERALPLVGPWGLEGYGSGPPLPEMAPTEDGVRRAPAAAAEVGDGPIHSGTNVQTAGVDEADLVKTDGRRILAVARGRLWLVDLRDGTPRRRGSLPLDGGWGQQIFLDGDRVLVMTSSPGPGPVPMLRDGPGLDAVPFSATPRTVLTEVDISDPDHLVAVRTLTLDGTVLSARMIDGIARVVVRSEPTGFAWEYPQGGGLRAERRAQEANRRLVAASTLENWVPWYVLEDRRTGTVSEGPLLDCDQVGHPDEFSGLSMLTVLTIDLGDGLDPGRGVGLLAGGETVYASTDHLYVATTPWEPVAVPLRGEPIRPRTPTTRLHLFDLTDPRTARYVASGSVSGVLLGQWSMDEYEGRLRVVVTDVPAGGGGRLDTPDRDVPETSVVVLERRGDRLVAVGRVGGLGENERVYAVRLMGDRGYVVTFRQVDPLYVLDLGDPTRPVVTGTLKIAGYSAYLHPIGDHLLLGVGQDADERGRVLGTQVAVFDVADSTRPRRLARLVLADGSSAAEWDHHAFLWWAPRDLAVLPLQRWSYDERTGVEDAFSGAVLVTATPTRVRQIGEITHPAAEDPGCADCPRWSPPVTRALVVGDMLYTVSEAGILGSDLDTLGDVAWIPFR